MEACDLVRGIDIIHSVNGGIGSGVGTKYTNMIREENYEATISSYMVFNEAPTNIEQYNFILANHQILENSDVKYILNVEVTNRILIDPTQDQVSDYFADMICNSNAPFRHKSNAPSSAKERAANMIPFPRMSYMDLTWATGSDVRDVFGKFKKYKDDAPIQDYSEGKFLTSQLIFRGDMTSINADKIHEDLCKRNEDEKAEWVTDSTSQGYIVTPYQSNPLSVLQI